MVLDASSMGLNSGRDHYCPEIIRMAGDLYRASFRSSYFQERTFWFQSGDLVVRLKVSRLSFRYGFF